MDLKTTYGYMRAYRQPIKVLKYTFLERFPFTAELWNGLEVEIKSKRHAWFYSTLYNLYLVRVNDEFIQLRYGDKVLKFHYDINGPAAFGEIFRDRVYDVDVKGKTVVDVGAGVGDSSIFFTVKGAKKVYAFDVETNYLERNVKENGLKEVIEPIRCECGLSNNLDVITLKYNIPQGSVLKVDCEGCEYGFLTSQLKRYSTVVVECHDGTQDIQETLQKAGFRTTVKRKLIYATRTSIELQPWTPRGIR